MRIPLVGKALFRRATARRALGHSTMALEDLDRARELHHENDEIRELRAQLEMEIARESAQKQALRNNKDREDNHGEVKAQNVDGDADVDVDVDPRGDRAGGVAIVRVGEIGIHRSRADGSPFDGGGGGGGTGEDAMSGSGASGRRSPRGA